MALTHLNEFDNHRKFTNCEEHPNEIAIKDPMGGGVHLGEHIHFDG